MTGWFFLVDDATPHQGPFTDKEILLAAYEGRVRPETRVQHPTNTKGQWVEARRLTSILASYQQGIAARQVFEEQEAAAKARATTHVPVAQPVHAAPPPTTTQSVVINQAAPAPILNNTVVVQAAAPSTAVHYHVPLQAERTSGFAIAGFLLAVFGWATCGMLCIPGVGLCVKALFCPGPRALAIAGILVGTPGVLFFLFWGMAFFLSLVTR